MKDNNAKPLRRVFAFLYAKPTRNWLRPALFSVTTIIVGLGITVIACQNPPPVFLKLLVQDKTALIISVGVILSELLALLIWLLATDRLRALAFAIRLTHKLRESETRFRLMADAAPAMIWMSDANRENLWANQGWSKFTGITSINGFSHQWAEYIHPDDVERYEKIRNAAHARHEPFSSEFRVRHRDGGYRWVMSTANPRFDKTGNFSGMIGAAIDITDRKRTEEDLKLASLVYRNSGEAMLIIDVNTVADSLTVIDVNPAYSQLTGYASADAIGQDPRSFQSPFYEKSFFNGIRKAILATGQWQGEYCAHRKNGGTFVTWLSISTIHNEQGNISRLVVIFHDITKRIEAEQTIRALSSSLISAKETEAKRIAHEIHDELGQHLTWLRLNIMRLLTGKNARQEALPATLNRMRDSVDNCLRIVRNIATGLRPAILDIGLVPAIEWLLDEFEANTGIYCSLHNEIESNLALEDVCATSIFRIVQESLTNVARHANARHVDISIATNPYRLALEIRDDGIGFRQKASPEKNRSLGLAGMRERAAILGGEFRISGQPNRGTIVATIIPLSQIEVGFDNNQ